MSHISIYAVCENKQGFFHEDETYFTRQVIHSYHTTKEGAEKQLSIVKKVVYEETISVKQGHKFDNIFHEEPVLFVKEIFVQTDIS
jgi:hypothetical protein